MSSLFQFYPAINNVFDVIHVHQTQETVSHRDIQTQRRELTIRCAVEYFDKILGVWIADETLS